MYMRRKSGGRRSWFVYLLILTVVITPVRLAAAMHAAGADTSAQSTSGALSHCERTASIQMEGGQLTGAVAEQGVSDCCDGICDCVNCGQNCYQIHIVSLIDLTYRDSDYQPPVLHAHVEAATHGITYPPFETPPIK